MLVRILNKLVYSTSFLGDDAINVREVALSWEQKIIKFEKFVPDERKNFNKKCKKSIGTILKNNCFPQANSFLECLINHACYNISKFLQVCGY